MENFKVGSVVRLKNSEYENYIAYGSELCSPTKTYTIEDMGQVKNPYGKVSRTISITHHKHGLMNFWAKDWELVQPRRVLPDWF